MVHLVIVHGRSQQYTEPVALKERWENAINQGLQRAHLPVEISVAMDFVYYGDVWRSDTERNPNVQAAQQLDENRAALAQVKGEPELTLGFVRELALHDWLKPGKLAGFIDEHTGLGEIFFNRHFKDVREYLDFGEARDDALKLVTDTVKRTLGDVILLGHSLGSIVSYDWINHSDDASRIKGLLTFGSPLGLRGVYEPLALKPPGLVFPAHLSVWYNVINPDDGATGDVSLSGLYRTDGFRQVQDRRSEGRNPELTAINAPHDGFVYASSMTFGRSLRAMIEAVESASTTP